MKKNPAPSVVLALRLPPEMADRVRALAESESRSVNGQLVWLLGRVLADYPTRVE